MVFWGFFESLGFPVIFSHGGVRTLQCDEIYNKS